VGPGADRPEARPAARPVFHIATPGNWFDLDLDLDPAARDRRIAALVDARAAASPEVARRRPELRRLLRRVARECVAGGGQFASLMSEAFEGEAMSASLTVAVRAATTTLGGGEPVTGVAAIADFFRRSPGAQAPGRETTVEVVSLPAGEAVRLQGLRTGYVPGLADPAEALMVQYLVPLAESPALTILTFTTPAVRLAEPFADLFDTMARTFAIEWEEQGSC
jgi:hypothetical protein